MQLHITRNKHSEPTVFETTFILKDDQVNPRTVPPHLVGESLELLAQQWWATRNKPLDEDMNAVLCERVEAWPEVTMAQLEAGLTITSEDSVLIAAVEERVKRACCVIADNHLYNVHFGDQESFILPVLPPDTVDQPQPSGYPVARPTQRTLEKARSKG
jgi:hypothetical protein